MSGIQQQQQVMSEVKEVNNVQVQKKVNPVYHALKARVSETAKELRSDFDSAGELKDALSARNKGVRCFMKKTDLFADDEALAAAIDECAVPDSFIKVLVSETSGVEALSFESEPENSAVVLYSPNSAPCSVIYGGLPSELTDLAIRSTLLWQLKAPALHLAESSNLCQLFAETSFYLPNVQVRKSGYDDNFKPYAEADKFNVNVIMMSDLESVLTYLTAQKGAKDIKLPNLITIKLRVPFMMALRQNMNRKRLGLAPIRNLIIGDIGMRSREKGVNSLFCQRLESVIREFEGCFDTVTVCGSTNLAMHVATYFEVVHN